jgi:preprotein translocase subunit SecG
MDLSNFAPYLSVAEIILGIVVVALVILQSKGSDLGSFMGGESGATHTRRGMEASLHRVTIGFFVAFFIVTLLTFIAVGQAG